MPQARPHLRRRRTLLVAIGLDGCLSELTRGALRAEDESFRFLVVRLADAQVRPPAVGHLVSLAAELGAPEGRRTRMKDPLHPLQLGNLKPRAGPRRALAVIEPREHPTSQVRAGR
jgi:hypothetical protein